MYILSTHDSIEAIPQVAWNRLTDPDTPFLRLREAIGQFLSHERDSMRDYLSKMHEHSPYKSAV